MSLIVNTRVDGVQRVEIDGSIILYRELGLAEMDRLVRKYMHMGKLPKESEMTLALEAMESMIVGWEGVVDQDGQPAKFKKAYIQGMSPDAIARFLDGVVTPAVERMSAKSDERTAEMGNS